MVVGQNCNRERYAENEEEEEKEIEVKLPKEIEMEMRECNSYGQWQFKRTRNSGRVQNTGGLMLE